VISRPAHLRGGPGSAAVAAGSHAAADAAASVLGGGGNAVDAAISAAFAATVAEPGLSSLGGGGFLLVRDPEGRTEVLDFFVAVPGRGAPRAGAAPEADEVVVRFPDATQTFRVGAASVAVPGLLDGLVQAHERWGTLPLAACTGPAESLARNGVALDPAQADVLALLDAVMAHTPESRAVFTEDGHPLAAGRRLRNPDLAEVLRRVGAGDLRGWRDAPLTEPLLEALRGSSLLGDADLDAYRVHHRLPVVAELESVHGPVVLRTNTEPSFGGAIVAEALAAWVGTDRSLSALPARVRAATFEVKARRAPGLNAVRGTTHVSVVDGQGWTASLTASNGSCAGVVAPATGIQLNNMMGEDDLHPEGHRAAIPGERLGSMMAPSVLELPGAVVAFGSGGSERIRSALSWVAARLLLGESLNDAVAAPRLHLDDAGVLHAEPSLPQELIDQAREWAGGGCQVNLWTRPDLFFGGVNAVLRAADGAVEAVADARRGGAVRIVPA
jgi:gamma-glutamyltranspeptidase/glutathione hydrolase